MEKEEKSDSETRELYWYAACEYGHEETWFGDHRSNYRAAKADALAHNELFHGGDNCAGVLNPIGNQEEITWLTKNHKQLY